MFLRISKQTLLIALSLVLASGPAFGAGGDINFFKGSLDQMKKTAQQSRMPYLIYFYVQDCSDCEKMDKESFNYTPFTNFADENYLAYKVDGLDFNSGIDIVQQYGVRQYPTVLVIGPTGDIRKRMEGFSSGPALLNASVTTIQTTDRNRSNRVISSQSLPDTRTTQTTSTRSIGNTSSGSFQGYPSSSGNSSNTSRNTSSSYTDPGDWGNTQSIVSSPGDPPAGSNSRGIQESTTYQPNAKPSGYVDAYLNNNLQNYSDYSTPPSGTSARSIGKEKPYVSSADINVSYIDDRSRAAYEQAATSGSLNSSQTGSRGIGKAKPDYFSSAYGDRSFVDERGQSGAQPSYATSATRGANNPPAGSSARSIGNPPAKEASFLDPVSGSQPAASGTRSIGNDPNINVSAYSARSINQPTNEPDNSFMQDQNIVYGSTRGISNDTRGVAAPKTVTTSVPGFSKYSPSGVKENTFSLVIGDYSNLSDLKNGIKKFESHSEEKLWAYSEKTGSQNSYKLVMGAYKGEQDAVAEALKMGASWDQIEVVNLANLK